MARPDQTTLARGGVRDAPAAGASLARGTWRAAMLRTAIPAVLTSALFAGTVAFLVLPAFEAHMLTSRKQAARQLAETAVSVVASHGRRVQAGVLTRDQAQRRAREQLRDLRYGEAGKQYFWITDLQPVVVMHPYLREIEGTDLLDMPDASGRPLLHAFRDIVAGPKRGGFCRYRWQHQDVGGSLHAKISYVKLYEPWGWIVGTGVYVDDIQAKVAAMSRTLILASGAILLVIVGLSAFMVIQSARRESLRLAAERAVREREQILAGILDNTLQFIGRLAPDGTLLMVNRSALDFAQVGSDAVIGKPFWETPWWTHSPRSRQTLREAIVECREQARTVHRSARNFSTDGTTIEVDFSLTPICDQSGAVESMIAEGRDVTAIHRATEALGRSEKDLAAILDSIGDGVIAIDPGGTVVRLNRVARRMLADEHGDVVGRALDAVVQLRDQDGQRLDDLAGYVLAAGDTSASRLAEHRTPGGEVRTVEITVAAVRTDAGVSTGGVLVLRDRTDEVALRQQLFQGQKLEAIGQLAGGVAHDFNNLLTVIRGNAELLSEQLCGREAETASVREIVTASSRAADLTRHLLAFSRKGKFQDAPVDVHTLTEEVVRLLRRSIDKRIELRLDLAASHGVVDGDPAQLQNALLNLGLNARDAMPDGGVLTIRSADVSLTAGDARLQDGERQPGRYLEVRVSDDGTGMDEATRRRIFEPFFTTKEPGKGTGLGLAGVYGCVTNHGGWVEVDTAVGRGTTFTLLLPISARSVQPASEAAAEPVPGRGRILVVDDEEAVQTFTSRALERLGYEVVLCADGREAVDYCDDHADALDLVILDLIMPRLGGHETYAHLRRLAPDLPVLIASGFSQNEAVAELIRQGAAGFLAKPYSLAQLSRTVRAHVRDRSGQAGPSTSRPVVSSP
jgi:PAS domain S-box-containing protein